MLCLVSTGYQTICYNPKVGDAPWNIRTTAAQHRCLDRWIHVHNANLLDEHGTNKWMCKSNVRQLPDTAPDLNCFAIGRKAACIL